MRFYAVPKNHNVPVILVVVCGGNIYAATAIDFPICGFCKKINIAFEPVAHAVDSSLPLNF